MIASKQLIHRDTNEVLGNYIHFSNIPQKIKNIFYPFVMGKKLFFFESKEKEGVYGCVLAKKGVLS